MAHAPYQAELEHERAQLLVRATVAEEQLSELQEYVDQHLGRLAGSPNGLGLGGKEENKPLSRPL